jgi:hypothetical protein
VLTPGCFFVILYKYNINVEDINVIFMNKKSLLGAALCALFLLVLSGCKTDGGPSLDPRLVGEWTNDKEDPSLSNTGTRKFTINADGSFECSINPLNQGRGTVIGILTADGDNAYRMSELEETTEQSWGAAVATFGNDPMNNVTIEFADGNTFTFTGENSTVNTFFGGTYYRLP